MNTPPTMNPASLPMAPIKSSKNKNLNKLDIRPKKLLYNDPDAGTDPVESTVEESAVAAAAVVAAVQEKSKISENETNEFTKHIEQNELDNEAEETQIEQSYSLRRRNKKSTAQNSKQDLKKKLVQKKIADKENVQLETPSTSDFDSKGEPLSQPSEELNLRDKIIWLQERRDIGIWIECCNKNCKKWRYVEEYHDPIQVPKKWFCSMNSDKKFASCNFPQDSNYEKCNDDLISNKYNAGSIVWGKINGYPWWPGMVDDCPETLNYYKLQGASNVPVKYHVTFFQEGVSRSWLTDKRIKPLGQDDDLQPTKNSQLVYKDKNYAKEIKTYLSQAKEALPLSLTERLKKFSFVYRYQGKFYDTSKKSKPQKKKKSSRKGVVKKRITVTKTNISSAKIDDIVSANRNLNTDDNPDPGIDFSSEKIDDVPSVKSNSNSKDNSKPSTSRSNFSRKRTEDTLFVKPNSNNLNDSETSTSRLEFSSEKTEDTPSVKPNSNSNTDDNSKPSSKLESENFKSIPHSSSDSPSTAFTNFLKPFPKPIVHSSSESRLASKSTKPSSDPFSPFNFYLKNASTNPNLSTALKSTPIENFETSSQLSFKSSSDDDYIALDFEPSLPTASVTASDIEDESSQSKQDDDEKKSEDNDSRSSSPFGGGAQGKEINRLIDDLIETYDSFDPNKLDEIDIEALKKSCNYDENQESSSDSEAEEAKNWFFVWKSDTEESDSDSDCEDGDSKKGRKSPKIVMQRIENFDEKLEKFMQKWDERRAKPPSPPPEVKARLKKFLFTR